MNEFLSFILALCPYIFILVLYCAWPSNILIEEVIKQLDLYYNSSIIMDISTNCDNKSNNILGAFGGIPKGRTYSEKPKSKCSANPFNYFVGKCKENPWFDYDICQYRQEGNIKMIKKNVLQ